MARVVRCFYLTAEAEYFLYEDWTWGITMKLLGNLTYASSGLAAFKDYEISRIRD
jgi:hypothetical protein